MSSSGSDDSADGSKDTTPYASISQAVSAASPGDTIKLLSEITSSGTISIKKQLTLDLNGQTLKTSGDNRINVVAGGDLTITDSSGGIGSIEHTVTANESSAISVTGEESNVAKLTLDKCEITVSGEGVDGYGIFAAKYSEITSGEGVTITAGYSAISGHGENPNVDINITGGEYTSNKFAAIYFPCVGNLTISGGSFTGLSGIEIRAGDASISNATITATGKSNNTVAAFNQPTNWGMGIVVFDHQSYAKDNSNEYLDINVFINNVTFNDDANFDIYVGKSPFDNSQASTGGLTFTQNNEKTVHDINIIVNEVDFEGKGLYLYGANDVEITNCNFKNITTSADSDKNNVNAIYLRDCLGFITIGGSEETGNKIENVSKTNENNPTYPSYGRGIYLQDCDTLVNISYNDISKIAFNAIQITGGTNSHSTSDIFNNIISEWDVDDDSVNDGHNDQYAGGRAIRLDVESSYRINISNNTFSKTYLPTNETPSFSPDLGDNESAVGYDDGNVLKITICTSSAGWTSGIRLELDNNVLNNSKLDYNNNEYVILPATHKAQFSIDPTNLANIGEKAATVSDLVSGYTLTPNDSGYIFYLTGTLKYVTDYRYSEDVSKQSGYFLPIRITFDQKYSELSNLKVTIFGDNYISLGQNDLDSPKDSTDPAYMDIVLFMVSNSISLSIEFTNNEPPITYQLYTSKMALEQTILPAPLHDNSGNLDLDNYQYSVNHLIDGVVEITADKIPYHQNAEDTMGYWIGVAIPVIEGINITDAKYYFGDLSGEHTYTNFSADDVYLQGGKKYVCFYTDVSNPKEMISIRWTGDDGSTIRYILKYAVTYESSNVVPAPLVDHSTSTDREINLNKYETMMGLNRGFEFIHITAEDVPKHTNGEGTPGYWVGIGLKSPIETTFEKAKVLTWWAIESPEEYDWSNAVSFDSHFTHNGSEYYSVYYDAALSSKSYNYALILIDWDGDGLEDPEDIAYIIDFNKVTLKSSSSGSGGGVPVTPPVTPEEPKEPIIPDSKGNAEIKVDEEKADTLVQETVTSGSKTLELIDKDSIEGTVTSVTVAVEDLKTISDKIENNQNINSVSIATSAGEVIIEKEVLSDILANTDAETIVVEVVDAKDQLNEEQKKVVGDNPVYDINIRAGSEYITNFNGNSITISIPYELQPGEDPNNLVVYYLKDDGTVEKMKGTYKDGKVSFETNHLSKFVIAYEAQEPVTPDNPDKPAKEDNDNTLYYIVAAIVVILIIVALAYYFLKKKQ